MTLNFVKMHAHGDDFVVIDLRGQSDPITAQVARRLGDRHRGIGFNQLALMLDCEDAAARIRFWNSDGSVLDTCGSATRGVADMLMREAGTSSIVLRTPRGLLTCARASGQQVSVDMGQPLLDWQAIPLAQAMDTYHLPLPGSPAACSMGNPHCTFFVEDLASTDVAGMGPKIETDPLFPSKTNVHFVQIINRNRIRLRIWERGGGIPQGSGSCCCGAVVNGIRRGLLAGTVEVECDGGTVTVNWDGTGGVVLTGPVEATLYGAIADNADQLSEHKTSRQRRSKVGVVEPQRGCDSGGSGNINVDGADAIAASLGLDNSHTGSASLVGSPFLN